MEVISEQKAIQLDNQTLIQKLFLRIFKTWSAFSEILTKQTVLIREALAIITLEYRNFVKNG